MIGHWNSRSLRIAVPGKDAGFTLLELLVVLALAGLLLSVVIPRLATIYQGVRSSLSRNQVEIAINGLGAQAYEQGRLLVLPAAGQGNAPSWLKLPPGWTLTVAEPIRFYPSGACDGGRVVLNYGGVRYPAVLVPPVCRLKVL